MEIIKDTKINGTLVIKEIDYDTAKKMMIEKHYSHKWNTSFGKINIGVFKDGRLLGACVFGNLMNPNSHSNISEFGKESVVELNRMWLDDELGKNAETVLISSSFKIIKHCYPDVKFVQSFADGRLGCGTVYKASNFKYFGFDESLFFKDKITEEVFHKVPLENTKRPIGFLCKNRGYLDGNLQAFKVKTFKYIYELYPKCKCKLKQIPYPEYSIGYEDVEFNHPIGLLCRLGIMYKAIGDCKYAKKVYDELLKYYGKDVILKEIENQKTNESVKWFLTDYINNPKNIESLLKRGE